MTELFLLAPQALSVFVLCEVVKNLVGWFHGWRTPVVLVPLVSAALAIGEVGIEDPRAMATHAAVLYFWAYGGTKGFKRLVQWGMDAAAAARAKGSIPPPPDLSSEPPPPPVTLDGALEGPPSAAKKAGLTFLVLPLFGCGTTLPEAIDAGRATLEIAEPCANAAHAAEIERCETEACLEEARRAFAPVRRALDLQREALCALGGC